MAAGFVFDDEPIESVLYGEPGSGPTPAGLFAIAEPIVSAIVHAFERGDVDEGLHRMAELLSRGDPVSAIDLTRFAQLVGTFVPQVPCPIVQERGIPYDTLLEPLFTAGRSNGEDFLMETAGTILYRYYEGCGRYSDAARVVGILLERAREKGNRYDEAVYSNNLGYDHLLEGDWVRAVAFFGIAFELFSRVGSYSERKNARLNLLLARYERCESRHLGSFEHRANRLLAALGNDWRRRKALILLARIAEHRGDMEKATHLARQAVEASEGIPTRHRDEDRAYLERLNR